MRKIVYKFFTNNSYLYDTIISNQLYFSSIIHFNDPYECHLTFPDEILTEDFQVYLEKYFEQKSTREKYLNAYKKNPREFIKPFIESFKELLSYYGICCFSETKKNILLWSHYADSHKGVVLGFDFELMTNQFKQFDKVDYNDTPFIFDIKDPSNSIAKTILRKSADWKYEEEIRFLMERSKTVGFNMQTLTEVNFGLMCSKRDILSIQYLVKKMGYSNCRFYKSKINEAYYSMEFEEVDMEKIKKEVLEESNDKRFSKKIDLAHLL